MHLVMFDIDGTLIKSNHIEAKCFVEAIGESFGIKDIPRDWDIYEHVTDMGIARTLLEAHFQQPASMDMLQTLKQCFLEKLNHHLHTLQTQVHKVQGVQPFMQTLVQEGFAVCIATGSYAESAMLKLETAGLCITDIPFASCDDSHIRVEIMRSAERLARTKYQTPDFQSITYIGDGIWDLKASQACGYQFIGIRDDVHKTLEQADHAYPIFDDFLEQENILSHLLKA